MDKAAHWSSTWKGASVETVMNCLAKCEIWSVNPDVIQESDVTYTLKYPIVNDEKNSEEPNEHFNGIQSTRDSTDRHQGNSKKGFS
jgi:hypothetical protein